MFAVKSALKSAAEATADNCADWMADICHVLQNLGPEPKELTSVTNRWCQDASLTRAMASMAVSSANFFEQGSCFSFSPGTNMMNIKLATYQFSRAAGSF